MPRALKDIAAELSAPGFDLAVDPILDRIVVSHEGHEVGAISRSQIDDNLYRTRFAVIVNAVRRGEVPSQNLREV